MDFKKKRHHMVDFLFVITLFFMFALSSMALVAIGANVYETSVENMDENFSKRTAYLYLTEKLRQSDSKNSVSCKSFGDSDAILLQETYNDTSYTTYLYVSDGYLKELLVKTDDSNIAPENGQNILQLSNFHVTAVSNQMLLIQLTDENGQDISFYISTHCSDESGDA